jgi:hypothetical protein
VLTICWKQFQIGMFGIEMIPLGIWELLGLIF